MIGIAPPPGPASSTDVAAGCGPVNDTLQGAATELANGTATFGTHPAFQGLQATDLAAAINGRANTFPPPSMLAGGVPNGLPSVSPGHVMFAPNGANLQARGASAEMQFLLGSWEKLRENMWSVVHPPAQGPQAMQQIPQQMLRNLPEGAMYLPEGAYMMPAPAGSQPTQQFSPVPHHLIGAHTGMPLLPKQDQAAPETSLQKSVEHEALSWVDPDAHISDSSHREFQNKLQLMRGSLIPELRARRSELYAAAQSIDSQISEVQQRCLEARRDGQAEFEALKANLSSVENLKLSVLGRERDERARLVDGIDETLNCIEEASSSSKSEIVTRFIHEFPELHAKAQSLWSRSAAVPQVEVGVHDIPFEARAKSDKLRKFAVMGRLQYAKDVCLWHLELQRRQFANEALEAGACLQHLEALLERYAEELAFSCYFCAERFSAGAANSRCLYNQSSRSSSPPSADPRVPSHVWGAGTHFWLPCNQVAGVRRGLDMPTGGTMPRMRSSNEDYMEVASGQSGGPSRHSTPPRGPPYWECAPSAHPPWAAGFAPSGGQMQIGCTPTSTPDLLLRKIAQACEQNGVDIRSAFSAFDANGDGFISPQEFRHAVSQLRIGASEGEIAWLLRGLDMNADGMVSYEEFLSKHFNAARDPRVANIGAAFVEHFSKQDAAAQSLWQRVARVFRDRRVPLRQAFALFDADGDGIISRQDLLEAFRLMHLGLTESDVERMMRDIDVNDDGKVSIHEFVNRLT